MAGYIIRDREKTLALPARQVDQLLAAADGDAALLYLYLMRAEDAVTAEQLMEKLSMSALRLQGAQTKLEKMGLIQAQGLPLPEPEQRPAEYTHAVFSTALDPNVFVLRLVPGMRADIIPLLAPHYRALVLESFGVGGLPGGEQGEMFAELRRWCDSGRLAVFTTQVPHEGCDLAVYEVGRAVGELPGVLEAHDMTPEAVAVKLMWALGQTQNRAEVMRLFETPVEIDII